MACCGDLVIVAPQGELLPWLFRLGKWRWLAIRGARCEGQYEEGESPGRVCAIAIGDTLARFLEWAVCSRTVSRCEGLFRILTRKPFDVVVLDLDLGDDTDVELISFTRRGNRSATDSGLILVLEPEFTWHQKMLDYVAPNWSHYAER